MSQRPHPIRVLVVDDSVVLRMSLAMALRTAEDIELIGELSDGIEAVALTCRLQPDLVLMDVSLPGIDGIEATRRIHAACPEVRIVGLSMYTDVSEDMLAAGAVACLDKATPAAAIVAAIRDYAGPAK